MILSHANIEEIAAAVIRDFNRFFFGENANEARSMPQGTPIDQFAGEYLRLEVSFVPSQQKCTQKSHKKRNES